MVTCVADARMEAQGRCLLMARKVGVEKTHTRVTTYAKKNNKKDKQMEFTYRQNKHVS